MENRSIRSIMPSKKVNMGGIILDQPLPQKGLDMVDPFLLVHHWEQAFKGGQQQSEVGVGPHPHRGFSPVTFIFKGGVHHRDSVGNSGVIDAGGTQWMNSGKGIVHSERPRKDIAEEGGVFEIIQFWVNTPAAKKMVPPSYQPLKAEDTPTFISSDKKVKVGVVSGEALGKKGPISVHSNLLTLRVAMQEGGKVDLPVPEKYNSFIYQLDGALTVNGSADTQGKNLIWFNNDGKSVHIEAKTDSRLILLAGEPINEPVSTYGPFVMNSQAEIIKALNDYQSGEMGSLKEVF